MQGIYIPVHVFTALFQESAILLNARRNFYYVLNDSAADFWRLLMQSNSVEVALQQLSLMYDSPLENLRQDMESLISSLLKMGLLEKQENTTRNRWLFSLSH